MLQKPEDYFKETEKNLKSKENGLEKRQGSFEVKKKMGRNPQERISSLYDRESEARRKDLEEMNQELKRKLKEGNLWGAYMQFRAIENLYPGITLSELNLSEEEKKEIKELAKFYQEENSSKDKDENKGELL